MASKKNAAPAVVDDVPFTTDGLAPEAGAVDEMTEAIVEAAPDQLAVGSYDFGSDHEGEDVKLKLEELIVPMLKIVQSSSKIFKNRDKAGGNPDVQEGDIYNSVTGQLYKNGVYVVPLDCTDCVIERKPAPNGEFIAKLPTKDARVQAAYKANTSEKNQWHKLTSPQKTQLVYTEEVPVGLLDPNDTTRVIGVAMVPFSGTNVFPRRQWWNGLNSVPADAAGKRPPKYTFRTLLKTKLRQGDGVTSFKFEALPFDGGSDWTKSINFSRKAADACKQFKDLYYSGALGKTDYSDVDSTDSESDAEKKALADKPDF